MGNYFFKNYYENQPYLKPLALMTQTDVYNLLWFMNKRCSAFATPNGSKIEFSLSKHIEEKSDNEWKTQLRINCCERQPSENEYDASQVVKTFTLEQFTTLCQTLDPLLISNDDFDVIHEKLTSQVTETPDGVQDPKLQDTNIIEECVLCFDNKADNILPCAHIFCSSCVSKLQDYNMTNCPFCRGKFDATNTWETASIPPNEEIYGYIMDAVNANPEEVS